MAHHGMIYQHGIKAMTTSGEPEEGRFGRLFPKLSANFNPPQELRSLGKKGGPMDGGQGLNPSLSIPLGFTFFGQFIDHDITFDTTSRLDRVNDPNATQNFRTPALDLDCIYGAGPEASEYLYDRQKLRLLTGADGTGLSGQTSNHSANDLARTSAGVAIIGDPRNDENRIISQLQLAMIRFHNHVVDHLIAEASYSNSDLQNPALRAKVFEEARTLVTWHYQWIVVFEFLPLIIGQPMVNQILGSGRQYYRSSRGFIPIEFSTAAYRFGHSLAPQILRTQKAQQSRFDLFGPTLGTGFSEVNDDRQIVEWDVFFDIDPSNPAQRAEKLDTKLSSDLLELPFLPADANSLATRNLLRGQSFLIPSGEQIAEAIGQTTADIEKVVDHVHDNVGSIDLSNGIPLWYYILAEAECIGRNDGNTNSPGEGLGPVGATIVGETLIGLLELDTTSFLCVNRNWTPSLGNGNDFTMADLLTFQ